MDEEFGTCTAANNDSASLTMEKITEAMNRLKGMRPNTMGGIHIETSRMLPEFTPIQTLSHKVSVTDEFRAEFNDWLIKFFGRTRTCYLVDFSKVKFGGKLTYVMHPNTLRALNLINHKAIRQ